MSNNNQAAIENAEQVIERFGGIRPMAKKIDVAVTTIQGWKKRNVIPATRREQVLEAAQTHNVDLSDILSAPVANQNEQEQEFGTTPPVSIRAERPELTASPRAAAPAGELEEKLAEMEKKAVRKSTWINIILLLLAIGAVAVLLWPEKQSSTQNEQRLSSLEQNIGLLRGDVDAVKAEQSFLSTLIPEDLDERIARLQQQASDTTEKIGDALQKAGEISQEMISDGSAVDPAERFGAVIQQNATPGIAALLTRIEAMRQSVEGQNQLDQTVSELSALASSFQGNMPDYNETLSAARQQSTTLGQTFRDVPAEDMKAAALLLAMSQFRQTLSRDNASFQEDLQLLQSLTGSENAELASSLARLAPLAQQGVLTPEGLGNEFRTLAGDVVAASLKGENISIQEKAKARLNDLFQMEKKGELITGTPTQATMSKAEKFLDQGDVAGAIAEVETLQEPAATAARPWLTQARATLMAQQLSSILEETIQGVASGSSKLVQNKSAGVNILQPAQPLGPEIYQ